MAVNKRVTLARVAKEAGVSRAAVYCVLGTSNRSTTIGVADITRQRIQQVAQNLGYIPSRAAQTLASGRSQTFGLLINDTHQLFDRLLIHLFDQLFHQYGYHLHTAMHNQQLAQERKSLEYLFSLGVDGLIWSPCKAKPNQDIIAKYIAANIPVIVLGERMDNPNCYYLPYDEFHGMRLLAMHLQSLTLQKIAYLGNSSMIPIGRCREKHLQQALSQLDSLYLIDSRYAADYNDCRKILTRWLEMTNPPQVVVCFNDHIAAVAINCLLAMGKKIPEDIAITGVDGLDDPFAPMPITTIRLPMESQVKACWDIFDHHHRGDKLPAGQCHFLKPELILRQSTCG